MWNFMQNGLESLAEENRGKLEDDMKEFTKGVTFKRRSLDHNIQELIPVGRFEPT